MRSKWTSWAGTNSIVSDSITISCYNDLWGVRRGGKSTDRFSIGNKNGISKHIWGTPGSIFLVLNFHEEARKGYSNLEHHNQPLSFFKQS